MSSQSFSQELPKWKNISNNACYDLEGAKDLKKFEVDCKTNSAKLTLKDKKIAELAIVAQSMTLAHKTLTDVVKRNEGTIDRQLKLLARQEKLLDEAEVWSLRGDALPWVLTAVVTVTFAAFFTGVSF